MTLGGQWEDCGRTVGDHGVTVGGPSEDLGGQGRVVRKPWRAVIGSWESH